LELNNEFDIPIWWHSRQIIWKDIRILTDYRKSEDTLAEAGRGWWLLDVVNQSQ
jgi:hypothetical protein